jgi:hypothetical protein
MFVFEIENKDAKAQISFPTDDYHARSTAITSGDPELLKMLADWVPAQLGPFGHPVAWPDPFVQDFDYVLLGERGKREWPYAARFVSGDRGDWYEHKLPEGMIP